MGRMLAGRTGRAGFAALCTGKEIFGWKRELPAQHCCVNLESKEGETQCAVWSATSVKKKGREKTALTV